MAIIKKLVDTKRLKTSLLKKRAMLYFFYDQNDALWVQIVPPDTETIVHYIDDDNLAFLYLPKSKEIVGLLVEDFKSEFLPKHPEIAVIWNKRIQGNFEDVTEQVEQRQVVIAKKVVKASQPIIEQEEVGLATLFDRSIAGVEEYAT